MRTAFARLRLSTSVLAAAVALAAILAAAPAAGAAAPARAEQPPFDPLSVVLVHGATLADARKAVLDTGLVPVTSFDRIGVVAARGTAPQIAAVGSRPGVTYVERNSPLRFTTETSHVATRGREAATTLRGANGRALDGTGVSVAVIDSGIDPTHPSFAGGKVVRNLKSFCLVEASTSTQCVRDVPRSVDTDTTSVGGHGTHVSGIAAGNVVPLAGGGQAAGAAPGARIVSLSTGAALFIIGADSALNWVLENHRNPCAGCPPIKAVNNSYGPSGGGQFDPRSATAKLQRALAADGVVTVWAAGNDGGDGTTSLTNPPGQDPTGGILSVASYFDRNTGTRNGAVSDYSSRGARGTTSTWPDISAPGEEIISSCRPYLVICSTGGKPRNGPGATDIGTFNTISGTSMAAPHITGIVAQLFQAKPSATPAEIEDALKSTAYRYASGAPYSTVGGYVTSYDKGVGLVDVVAAATKLGAVAG